FFFFQAEDGIRDFHVTGVQTCALPICPVSNVIFIELVEVVILPISFFILIFPIFSKLYDFLIISFNKIALLFSKVFVINLKFPRSEERRVGKECRFRWVW